MKKLIVCLALASSAVTSNAHGIGNFLLGATVGYSAAHAINNRQPIYFNGTPVYNIPQRVYVQPQPQVYVQPQPQVYVQPQPQVYVQPQIIERTPIYEQRSQYDFDCQCYITINNQIGWQ